MNQNGGGFHTGFHPNPCLKHLNVPNEASSPGTEPWLCGECSSNPHILIGLGRAGVHIDWYIKKRGCHYKIRDIKLNPSLKVQATEATYLSLQLAVTSCTWHTEQGKIFTQWFACLLTVVCNISSLLFRLHVSFCPKENFILFPLNRQAVLVLCMKFTAIQQLQFSNCNSLFISE